MPLYFTLLYELSTDIYMTVGIVGYLTLVCLAAIDTLTVPINYPGTVHHFAVYSFPNQRIAIGIILNLFCSFPKRGIGLSVNVNVLNHFTFII